MESIEPPSAPDAPSPLPKPRRLRGLAIGLTLTLLGVGALGAGAAVAVSRSRIQANQIAPGIQVAHISVGGLTKEEATEKLRTWARERLTKAVVFKSPDGERKWARTLGELGGRYEIAAAIEKAVSIGKDDTLFERVYYGTRERNDQLEPLFKINEKAIDEALEKIAKDVYRAPKNARAKMDKKGALNVTERDEDGVVLDSEATKKALLKDGIVALAEGAQIELVLKEEKPKVTAEALGKIGTLLASYTTDVSGTSDRRANVRMTAKKIDGTLLAPGDVFSYNEIVGPRTTELGWKMAHQFQDGLVVDGVGGGVCQGSSTLYNAVLRADLKVVSRSNHSMRVGYVPAGCDATVSYDGGTDFKFENSTDGPIYVGASCDGERITFRIFGTAKPAREVLSVYTGDRRPVGEGYSVTTYRRIKEADGMIKTERIDSSTYRPPKSPAH